MRSWLRVYGSYRLCRSSAVCAFSVPMMIRSGFMKSLTAAPSLRNSGFEATSNSTSEPRLASASATASFTLWAVPTGTVDLVTTSLYSSMNWPIVFATWST